MDFDVRSSHRSTWRACSASFPLGSESASGCWHGDSVKGSGGPVVIVCMYVWDNTSARCESADGNNDARPHTCRNSPETVRRSCTGIGAASWVCVAYGVV